MRSYRSWKDFLVNQTRDKHRDGNKLNQVDLNNLSFKTIFNSMLWSYCDDDVRFEKKVDARPTLSAVSWAKFSNPFLHIQNGIGLIHVGTMKAVDHLLVETDDDNKTMMTTPTAQRVKQIIGYPTRAIMSGLAPAANIHRMPLLSYVDRKINKTLYGQERSPLAYRMREENQSKAKETAEKLGYTDIKQIEGITPTPTTKKSSTRFWSMFSTKKTQNAPKEEEKRSSVLYVIKL